MENKIKVICPKCQAKLKIATGKLKAEVTRYRCPNCSAALRLKKPVSKKEAAATLPLQVKSGEEKSFAPSTELQRPVEESDREKAQLDSKQDEVITDEVFHEPISEKKPQKPITDEKSAAPDLTDESDSPVNLRKHKRVKFKKKVLVDNQIMVEALDISEKGLFLHTGRSFDDGATVQVGIPTLPGCFDLVVQATVQHNHRGIGMGLEFVDIDDTQKDKLHKLINTLDEAAQKEQEGRKIILLAGGSDTARNINKSKLVLDGFYVLQASKADEVFEALKNETPDAMVLDWQDTSFYSRGLMTQIRKTPQYDNVIIIVLSALTDAHVHKEILDAGADRYMAKMDTNPAKLSQTLKQLIDEREG
jgi:CheY-like chemotaxis protein